MRIQKLSELPCRWVEMVGKIVSFPKLETHKLPIVFIITPRMSRKKNWPNQMPVCSGANPSNTKDVG
jgi:hypothetical protein